MIAVLCGMADGVRTLLEVGADARATHAQHHCTALWLCSAPWGTPATGLRWGSRSERGDRAACGALLLAARADGPCRVLQAAARGAVAELGALLESGEPADGRGGFLLDEPDEPPGLTTPLVAACANGQHACLHLLLDAKADVHLATRLGETALSAACAADRLGVDPELGECAATLVRRGARLAPLTDEQGRLS